MPQLETLEEVVKVHGDSLQQFMKEDIEQDAESGRLSQIAEARRNYLYWQGKQYLVPTLDGQGRTVNYRNVFDSVKPDPRLTIFASVYNIIKGDGLKFCSLTGQRRPNQKCVADDPESEVKVKQARLAQSMLRYLHRQWKLQQRMASEVSFHIWTTGTVFARTEYVTDGPRFGWREEQTVEMTEVETPASLICPQCQAKNPETAAVCQSCGEYLSGAQWMPGEKIPTPQLGAPQRYENGGVDLTLLSVFHISHSPNAKGLDDAEWLDYAQMLSVRRLAALGFEGDVSQDTSGEQVAKAADEALREVQNTDRNSQSEAKDRVYCQRWLRPSVYHGTNKALRDDLLRLAPEGARVHIVGGAVRKIEAENMTSKWAACKTGTSEFLNGAPLCSVNISIQDDINNLGNMAKEIVLRSVPKVAVDGNIFNEEKLRKQEALIHEVIFTDGTADLSRAMKEFPTSRFSDQLIPLWSQLRAYSRELGGITEALWGGGPPEPTWRASQQKKNSAMQQLQSPFDLMQTFVSQFSENGIHEAARHGVGEVLVAPDPENVFGVADHVSIEELDQEGWHCEADEGTPQTFGEKVERISQLTQENPELANAVGLNHPMNV